MYTSIHTRRVFTRRQKLRLMPRVCLLKTQRETAGISLAFNGVQIYLAEVHTMRVFTLPRSAVQTVGQHGCVLFPVLEEVRIIKLVLFFVLTVITTKCILKSQIHKHRKNIFLKNIYIFRLNV